RYQRTDRVWPLDAKSYLVETVIMGLVLPPLLLHQVVRTRNSGAHIDIVDGQQRTAALREFRDNTFELSNRVGRDLRGRSYATLRPADRRKFDDYVLKMDRIEDAEDREIRDVFQRINSYTVPLNYEEQRNAEFQGEFKWFIRRDIEKYAAPFQAAGVLSQKQIDRMADAKLLTEIVHAMINGITTTNKKSLHALYHKYNREFKLARDIARRLSAARHQFAGWGQLPKPLRKPYHAYSLFLALLDAQQAVRALRPTLDRHKTLRADPVILRNLMTLSEVL